MSAPDFVIPTAEGNDTPFTGCTQDEADTSLAAMLDALAVAAGRTAARLRSTPTPAAPDVAGGVEEDEPAWRIPGYNPDPTVYCRDQRCRDTNWCGSDRLHYRDSGCPTPPPQPAEREASTGAPEQDEAAVEALAGYLSSVAWTNHGTRMDPRRFWHDRAGDLLAALTARRIPGFGPSVGAGEGCESCAAVWPCCPDDDEQPCPQKGVGHSLPCTGYHCQQRAALGDA